MKEIELMNKNIFSLFVHFNKGYYNSINYITIFCISFIFVSSFDVKLTI